MSAPALYSVLREEKEYGETGVHNYCLRLHPNPEFYKYYFYHFTEDSPQEGEAFFKNKDNRLCIAEAMKQRKAIEAAGDLAFAYNRRHPRRGDATPFDESHPKWKNVEWAPPLSEDPDPPVEGGHR